ncbi:hypothetical protein V1498_12155 [Peribacillus sp. SCS-26]|uniref:hypothetical protein n=1 Tax=Paraperibacillus marinus TaxID=3115295 RepID=UPI0039065BBB
MEQIEAFPIYFCAEIPSFRKEDYEKLCKKQDIVYKYLKSNAVMAISVTDIKNMNQLRKLMDVFISIGSSNDLVVWSTKRDSFRVEERRWQGNWEGKIRDAIVVTVDEDTNVFWIGHDGDSIVVISNSKKFSSYENIGKTFPSFVRPTVIEYE